VARFAQSLAVSDGVGPAFGMRCDVVGDGRSLGETDPTDRITSEDGVGHSAGEAAPLTGPGGGHVSAIR
jgi:hypothetical protein